MRTGAVALALLAMLFVLARPVCAAQGFGPDLPYTSAVAHAEGTPQHPHHSDPCCEALDASVIATPSTLAAPAAAAALPVSAFVRMLPRISLAYSVFVTPPPPPLPYHARSARILR
jgi:hypothetical protein